MFLFYSNIRCLKKNTFSLTVFLVQHFMYLQLSGNEWNPGQLAGGQLAGGQLAGGTIGR